MTYNEILNVLPEDAYTVAVLCDNYELHDMVYCSGYVSDIICGNHPDKIVVEKVEYHGPITLVNKDYTGKYEIRLTDRGRSGYVVFVRHLDKPVVSLELKLEYHLNNGTKFSNIEE